MYKHSLLCKLFFLIVSTFNINNKHGDFLFWKKQQTVHLTTNSAKYIFTW